MKIRRFRLMTWSIRLFTMAGIALVIAYAMVPRVEASEILCPMIMESHNAFTFLDCHVRTARTNGLPVTAVPEWHPNTDEVGEWMIVRAVVGDEHVKKECKTEAYACAKIRVKLKIQTCEIYMPDFEHVAGQTGTWRDNSGRGDVLFARVPRGQKPPAEWFWLLGRETGHCLYGKYHD